MKINEIASHILNNHEEIKKSSLCGCFFCLKVFSPEHIVSWADKGKTALCPTCDKEFVLSDSTMPITVDNLSKVRNFWIGEKDDRTEQRPQN